MDLTSQLDALAEVAVKVGVGLLPGQKLLIGAPLEAAPLVRKIVEHAYCAGSRLVTVLWDDPAVTAARYEHAVRDSFTEVPAWLFDGAIRALEENSAYLHVSGEDPMALSAHDPELIAIASKARAAARRRWSEIVAETAVNWCVVPFAGAAWARKVFSGQTEGEAIERLWQVIFQLCRIDDPDPVAAWGRHASALSETADWLSAQRFSALHVTGPGTDLLIGLVEGHRWVGASSTARNGAVCIPNIPTEEVFTMPHALRVEGHARATKPLSVRGCLVEEMRVEFREGRVVDARASRGQLVLDELLDCDEGARRLGEVALVPHSSLVSASGLLFYNSYFDENAAIHIAFGQCYAENLQDYAQLSPTQRRNAGANESLIHVDWMIGSAETNVDGVDAQGAMVPVIRAGDWAR